MCQILPIPPDLSISPLLGAKIKCNSILRKYCYSLKNFDIVDIQCAFGTFGYKISISLPRITRIVKSCRPGSCVLDSHDMLSQYLCAKWAHGKIFGFIRNRNTRYLKKLLRTLKKVDGRLIVHSQIEKMLLSGLFPKLKITALPLCWRRQDDCIAMKAQFSRADYMKKNGIRLPDSAKVISVVGHFADWKDIGSVVKAMAYLPENYHLFIHGGQHPFAFTTFKRGHPLVEELSRKIVWLKLNSRVHFMGFVEDSNEIEEAYMFSDYVVVPNVEYGEVASGTLSASLEFCKNVFVNRNIMSNELKEFAGRAFFTYDMGNYLELAAKIQALPHKEEVYANRLAYFEKYNVALNVENFMKGGNE